MRSPIGCPSSTLKIVRKHQAKMRSSQWHPDHLDGAKRRLCAAHFLLAGRSNNQSDVMEFGKRCRMTVADKRDADTSPDYSPAPKPKYVIDS